MKRAKFQIHPDLFYTDSVSQGVKSCCQLLKKTKCTKILVLCKEDMPGVNVNILSGATQKNKSV